MPSPPPEQLPGVGRAWRTERGVYPQGRRQQRAQKTGSVGRVGAGGGLRRLQDATCQQKSFLAELTPAPPWYPGDPLTTQHEGATPGKAGWAQHVRGPLSRLFNILTVPQARSLRGRTIRRVPTLNALGSEGDRSAFRAFGALPSHRTCCPSPLIPPPIAPPPPPRPSPLPHPASTATSCPSICV